MSVTLKLADQDAKLAGDIMQATAKFQARKAKGEDPRFEGNVLDRLISSEVMATRVAEIAAAFHTAVRANAR